MSYSSSQAGPTVKYSTDISFIIITDQSTFVLHCTPIMQYNSPAVEICQKFILWSFEGQADIIRSLTSVWFF